MASWKPIDISQFDRDEIADEDVKWDDDVIKGSESRFEVLRQDIRRLNKSRDEATREDASISTDATRHDIEELVANEIYDKLTILLNNARKRFDIQKGAPILEPLRNYDNFKLADDGEISYVYKRTVIDLGNINERLKAPREIRKLGVKKLRLMGFTTIADEDIDPYRLRYKRRREEIQRMQRLLKRLR